MTHIRVGIADDQALVRGGLAMLVGSQPDMSATFEAEDGRAALAAQVRTPADVVLMDVRMPVLDGLAATRRMLAGAPPHPKVVVLTTFDLDEYVVEAIKAGASGFLLKDARPEHLLDAIRVVRNGDAVIAPAMTRRLLDHVAPLLVPSPGLDHEGAARIRTLSAREHDVFLLIAAARSNAEIAAQLYLSETTVKTHVAHVLEKLGTRDRVQAAVLAYEAGVVGPGSRGAPPIG